MLDFFKLSLMGALLFIGGCGDSTDESTDTSAPTIKLNGETDIVLNVGDTYSDAGASVIDDISNNLQVVVTGSVDTSTPGTYVLTYTSSDEAGNTTSITRTITVNSLPDTQAPELSIVGDATVTLIVGSAYSEEGATAVDDQDNDVEISINGDVDTDTIGTYTVNYTARDNAGNESTLSKTVIVIAAPIEGDAYIFHSSNDDSYFMEFWGDTWGTGTSYTDSPTDTTYSKSLEIQKSSEWGTVVAWGNEEENAIDISQFTHAKFKVKTSTFHQVQVFVQSPSNVDTEIVYNLSKGVPLSNGWVEMEVKLPEFTEMTWFALNFIGDSGSVLLADVHFTTQDVDVTGPPLAAPTPSVSDDDAVIVLFSDVLIEDRWISVWNSNWWNAPAYAQGSVAGDNFAKYEITDGGTEGGIAGLEFGFELGPLNANSTTTWNFDMFVEPGISKISLQLVSSDGSSTYVINNPPAGSWNTYSIRFDAMTDNDGDGPGVMSQGALQAAGVQLWGPSGKAIYLDNIYFSGEAVFQDVTVTVKSEQNQLLSGAKVVAGNVEALTDANGVAILNLPDGEHRLLVDAAGFGMLQSVVAVNSQPVAHNVTAVPLNTGPSIAAPVPQISDEDAVVIYSDELIVDQYISFWSDNWWNAPSFEEITIGTNKAAKLQIIPNGENGGITGIQYGIENGALDAGSATGIRFDIFATSGISKIEIQVLSTTGAGLYSVPIRNGQWFTVDVPFSSFRDGHKITASSLTQLGVQLWGSTSDAVYLDNIYFY